MSEPAIPDILSQRSGLSFSEALDLHPDLKIVVDNLKSSLENLFKENSELEAKVQAGTPILDNGSSLQQAQDKYAKQLDELIALLDKEKDQFRVEILRTIYADGASHWQSMVLQLHMMRGSQKAPGAVHVYLLKEATALLQRQR